MVGTLVCTYVYICPLTTMTTTKRGHPTIAIAPGVCLLVAFAVDCSEQKWSWVY